MTNYSNHLGCITSLEFLNDSRFFLSTSKDNTFRIWRSGMPFQFKKIGRSLAGYVINSYSLKDHPLIAYQCSDDKVKIYILDFIDLYLKKQGY